MPSPLQLIALKGTKEEDKGDFPPLTKTIDEGALVLLHLLLDDERNWEQLLNRGRGRVSSVKELAVTRDY